jgi:hypothetical protein
MSLCFLQALAQANRRENSIADQEYIKHLVAHFRGIRHPEDATTSVGDTLAAIEPWAGSLREIAITPIYSELQGKKDDILGFFCVLCTNYFLDTSAYESLFLASLQGDISGFKTALQESVAQNGPNPLQPAACLAAQKQQHHILRYCLQKGAVFDRYLNRAAQMGAQTPAMLELLFEVDWAGVKGNDEAVRQQVEHFGEDSFQAKWLLATLEKSRPEVNTETAERSIRSKENDKGATEQGPSRKKDTKGGRDLSKGKGSRDSKQVPNPNDIQKWFGDVPW